MSAETQAIEQADEKAEPMQTNMRIAVGTLIATAICVLVTAAMWTLPLALSNGGDPSASGWGILSLMFSIIPAGLAAVLFVVSIVYFVIASSGRHPR